MTATSEKEDLLQAQAQLGKRIRGFRKARRFSQRVLARLCNLHVSHLSKIERGLANLTVKTLLNIARACGVTPSELFAEIQVSGSAGEVDAEWLSDREKALAKEAMRSGPYRP